MSDASPTDPIRYPTNTIVGVLDTQTQVDDATAALTAGGFLDSEIHVTSGVGAADALGATTARTGLADIATRIAGKLGIQDDEMESKAHYEQAMRDGRFVIRVAAPTDERKDRAADILRTHGAHSVSFLGRFTIEGIVPPEE